MKRVVERRLQYFLTTRRRGREDVSTAVRELEKIGRLAIVGGMIRDLALFGNGKFRSDVDLVVDARGEEGLARWAALRGAKRNRFGGYSAVVGRWTVDVWLLAATWAHRAGHVEVNSFADVRRATFFSCDAVVYDLQRRRLIPAKGYFDRLEKRILEVNLEATLNPTGNTVRAFRYAIQKGFRWGPKLSKFVCEELEREGWEALIREDMKAVGGPVIGELRRTELEGELWRHIRSESEDEFDLAKFFVGRQSELEVFVGRGEGESWVRTMGGVR